MFFHFAFFFPLGAFISFFFVSFFFFFFWGGLVILFWKAGFRERETVLHWCTPQVAAAATADSIQSQNPRAPSRSCTCCLPRTETGSCIKNGGVRGTTCYLWDARAAGRVISSLCNHTGHSFRFLSFCSSQGAMHSFFSLMHILCIWRPYWKYFLKGYLPILNFLNTICFLVELQLIFITFF